MVCDNILVNIEQFICEDLSSHLVRTSNQPLVNIICKMNNFYNMCCKTATSPQAQSKWQRSVCGVPHHYVAITYIQFSVVVLRSVSASHQDGPSKPDVCQRVAPLYSEKTPKDAALELQQCISRMGDKHEEKMAQHTADSKTMPQETSRKPKAPKPKPPVRTSSIEQKKTAPLQQLPQKQQIPQSKPQQPTDPARMSQGMRHKQPLGQFDSATSCIEAYATLPRKPGQRASHKAGLDTDVYESYLQRQRAATTCMPGTVATSGGCVKSGDKGSHAAPRSRSNSSSSYKCPSVEQSVERSAAHPGSHPAPHPGSHPAPHPGSHPASHPAPHPGSHPGSHPAPHPGIMEQLIREGLIDNAAPHNHAAGSNVIRSRSNTPVNGDMARDGERHVRRANPTGPAQSIHTGRQTLKQKQQAVTQALYYGRPTAAVTQPIPSNNSHRGIHPTLSIFSSCLVFIAILQLSRHLVSLKSKMVYFRVFKKKKKITMRFIRSLTNDPPHLY